MQCTTPAGGPGAADVLVVSGASLVWATVTDGWIRKEPPADFKRGDSNADGQFDISDPLATFNFHFLGARQPSDCLRAADVDDDGSISLTDVIYSLVSPFLSPQVPAPPWEACGPDTTPDDLTCRSFSPCK